MGEFILMILYYGGGLMLILVTLFIMFIPFWVLYTLYQIARGKTTFSEVMMEFSSSAPNNSERQESSQSNHSRSQPSEQQTATLKEGFSTPDSALTFLLDKLNGPNMHDTEKIWCKFMNDNQVAYLSRHMSMNEETSIHILLANPDFFIEYRQVFHDKIFASQGDIENGVQVEKMEYRNSSGNALDDTQELREIACNAIRRRF
jgi:hypothetical protein